MKRYFVVTMCMLYLVVLCCACGNNDNKYNYIELGNDVYNMSEADYKGACESVAYNDFRNEVIYSEEHKKIQCTGEVVQICNEQTSDSEYYSEYRVNITKVDYGYGVTSYVDDIYVYYMLEKNPKLLESDIVTLYGEKTESVTYTTVNNANRTIPAMVAVYVDINE